MQIMTTTERYAFLNRLLQATQNQKVVWEVGASEYWFYTKIGRFLYAVTSEDMDDYAPFTFHIYSENSDAADASTRLASWHWDETGESPLNPLLARLYTVVKERSLGFDRIVHDMIADLAQLDGGPPELGIVDEH